MKSEGKPKAKDLPKPSSKGEHSLPQTSIELVTEEYETESFKFGKTLKPEHKTFADHFLSSRNQTRSYMQAYPLSTYGAAAVSAFELLNRPKVKEYMRLRRAEMAELMTVEPHDLTREFAEMAFSDIGDAYDESGNLKPIHDMPKGLRSRITAIEVDVQRNTEGEEVGKTKRIRFGGKEVPLENIGRHLGYYAKDKITKSQIDLNVKKIATVIMVPAFTVDADDVSAGKPDNGHNGSNGHS
jgi:phage terminase small subunit